jgi:hypothetical protein
MTWSGGIVEDERGIFKALQVMRHVVCLEGEVEDDQSRECSIVAKGLMIFT